ncbi:hypothetical protein [Lysinibacillus piscis]|uniref:Uncharacterized protein n=1 Tax=Lysinibacillus piscis TaxID=2518931 RepID=A0ABQ5NJN3_9BACI|nr:hypothetical protein [Lysinibacillus sp. KH24]GLC88234.1 hypothetical protein LYSBPC_13610 [Lysinibacillus sp. KH24]
MDVENPMVLGRIEYPQLRYQPCEPVVSFEMYDDFGSLIVCHDVYFVIGDAIVHMDNISDYLVAGYQDYLTYEMADFEVIAYVELHYGSAHIKK